MAEFERSRGRGRGSRDSSSSRGRRSFDDGPRRSFDDGPRRRDSSRGSGGYGRGRRDVEMTKVTCSSCGVECEVPFKPTSSKPVYCSECFRKDKPDSGSDRSSKGISNKDIDQINEKLNKIMKALKIE